MQLVIKRGLDLRLRLDEKQEYAQPMALVVLVNNAHTIAHGILAEDPDLLIRTRLPSWLKGASDTFLEKYLTKKYDWLLVTQVKPKPEPVAKERDFLTRRRYRNYERKWKKR